MTDAGTVTVFGSSRATPVDPVYRDARRLGRLLAVAGYAVRSGGYSGVMEAVSRGAAEAGGQAIGVTVESWSSRPNAWNEKPILAHQGKGREPFPCEYSFTRLAFGHQAMHLRRTPA